MSFEASKGETTGTKKRARADGGASGSAAKKKPRGGGGVAKAPTTEKADEELTFEGADGRGCMVPRGAIALVFEEMEWAKKVVSGYQKNGPPMQKCMLGTMAAVHIVWISKQQLYDVKDLHVCPHYTLTAMEVEQLTLKAREHKIRVRVSADSSAG